MSKTYALKLDLAGYWHVGSGRGDGAVADAVVLRDASGLPLVPGRTLKGLVRDAMTTVSEAGLVPQERLLRWFGSGLPGHDEGADDEGDAWSSKLEQGRFSTQAGALWFGSAQLPAVWRDWARGAGEEAPEVQALYAHVASTAVDAQGVARDHTLRVVEVAVPMTLVAEVRGPEGDDTWVDDVRLALPLIRALGSRRSRGFGRVQMHLE